MGVVIQNTASHASHVSCWSPASSDGHRRPNSSSPSLSELVDFIRFEGRKGHPHRASIGSHNNHHHAAHRRFRVRPDIIDRLDDVSGPQYHHEGPYDAACAERNNCSQSSPVAALRDSNAEILKATPPYKIDDCLRRHRPLDGVAFYPPGTTDLEGNTYRYYEGSNVMTELDTNFIWSPRMVSFHPQALSWPDRTLLIMKATTEVH
jgi:Pal1 cell morphology protein